MLIRKGWSLKVNTWTDTHANSRPKIGDSSVVPLGIQLTHTEIPPSPLAWTILVASGNIEDSSSLKMASVHTQTNKEQTKIRMWRWLRSAQLSEVVVNVFAASYFTNHKYLSNNSYVARIETCLSA